MAYIGLRNPIIGKRTAAGKYATPAALGKAISIEITPNFNEASLYADDGLAEYVKEFKDADITLGTSTIPAALHAVMFGHTVEENAITFNKDDQNAYVGFAVISQTINDDERKYEAIFIPKVKFSDSSDSFETKGDSVTFKTPSISGKASAEDDGVWKYVEAFATEAEATAWVNKKFGVTA